jgi:multicomponent Na+:H+ antiporter subunit E
MKTKITLFIFCYIIWVFLDWPLDIQHALAGVAVASVVIFLTGSMFKQPVRSGIIRICLGLCRGMSLFIRESLKTNIDFILRVFNPEVSINARIVKVNITLKTDIGIAFLANLVMLASPGVCINVSAGKDSLYIHWIGTGRKDHQEAAQLIVNKFEKVLKIIFG